MRTSELIAFIIFHVYTDVLLFITLKRGYMLDAIKNNPVRAFEIAAAILALVVFYVPTIPAALVLALVTAVLGIGGEAVRNSVMPTRKLPSEIVEEYK